MLAAAISLPIHLVFFPGIQTERTRHVPANVVRPGPLRRTWLPVCRTRS